MHVCTIYVNHDHCHSNVFPIIQNIYVYLYRSNLLLEKNPFVEKTLVGKKMDDHIFLGCVILVAILKIE